ADRNVSAVTRSRRVATSPVDDEAEAEELALIQPKPIEEQVTLLRAFIDKHPQSKSRLRATEILVSAHARVGDERLKRGDNAGGIEQFMLAIADAPVDASE